jgi:hypothetical protein
MRCIEYDAAEVSERPERTEQVTRAVPVPYLLKAINEALAHGD